MFLQLKGRMATKSLWSVKIPIRLQNPLKKLIRNGESYV